MSSIKVGDPVKLTGGGRDMTVTADASEDHKPGPHWECVWHLADGTEQRAVYPEAALIKIPPKP